MIMVTVGVELPSISCGTALIMGNLGYSSLMMNLQNRLLCIYIFANLRDSRTCFNPVDWSFILIAHVVASRVTASSFSDTLSVGVASWSLVLGSVRLFASFCGRRLSVEDTEAVVGSMASASRRSISFWAFATFCAGCQTSV